MSVADPQSQTLRAGKLVPISCCAQQGQDNSSDGRDGLYSGIVKGEIRPYAGWPKTPAGVPSPSITGGRRNSLQSRDPSSVTLSYARTVMPA